MSIGRWALTLSLLIAPISASATTADDLSSRITIDGLLGDYTADEWLLDSGGARPERPDDSQWGPDNELHRIALTWDHQYIYLAVEGTAFDSSVMALMAFGTNGIGDLAGAGVFRRAIDTGAVKPDVLILAQGGGLVDVARSGAASSLRLLGEATVARAFARAPDGRAALELAIPWSQVDAVGPALKVLAVTTAGPGSGCGDAAPDPSAPLSSRRAARASLDQFLSVVYDADMNAVPDSGVSPRAAATVVSGVDPADDELAAIGVHLEQKAFAPDRSEALTFTLCGDGDVYLTCRVYSMDGRMVRELYVDDYRAVRPGDSPDPADRWDGRDGGGRVVPGGVYIVNLQWGSAPGVRDASTRKSVVVVR